MGFLKGGGQSLKIKERKRKDKRNNFSPKHMDVMISVEQYTLIKAKIKF
jgi:hypothetical protein